MDSNEDYGPLVKWLEERGHSEEEIRRIMVRVRQYDEQTMHDSVMDSIGSGHLTLETLIKEALDE